MAAPVIQTSFAVGEVSPYLHGRVDLTKYKIGAAKMSNFMVDYKGGASKRPGTRFVGKAPYPLEQLILVPFQFNESQTYVLELGYYYMRVITNGGYVLDASGNIYTISAPWHNAHLKGLKFTQSADTMTFVHPLYPPIELIRFGHADWRFIYFSVGATTTPPGYVSISAQTTGYVDPAAAAYTNMSYGITTIGQDGSESMMSPIARLVDVLDMTAHKVVTYIVWSPVQGKLFYNVWKASTGFGAQMPAGTRLGFIGSSQGEYFIDNNILPSFVRSPPIHSNPFAPGAIEEVIMTNYGGGYVNGGAWITISDSTGYGAILTPQIRDGACVGAIVENGGQSYTNPTLTFNGAGVVTGGGSGASGYPNFDENNQLVSIDVASLGSGYSTTTTVVIQDGGRNRLGEGAAAVATVSGGQVVGYTVTNGGNGLYNGSLTTVNVSDTGSATINNSASGYAKLGPANGTYPGAVAYYQQRLLFAASINRPSTLWGSKPGSFHNFDVGIPVTDGDSYEFTLASQQLNAIKYMIGMPGGLVVLTSGGAWQLSGTQQFAPITPTQIMATPQAFHGCADLQPITIGYEILFVQAAGSIVRNLSYNFFANIYTSADVTVLSSHLFSGRTIRAWTYAEEPDKTIWMVQDSGKLLSFAFLKEQEVAGWAQHSTNGQFRAVASVREGLRDVTYFAVDRWNQTHGWYTAIERLAPRSTGTSVEDAWYLDCALSLPPGYVPQTTMYSGAVQKTGMAFYAGGIFTAGYVGIILRVAGGKYRVTGFIDANWVTADEIYPVTETYYNEEGNYYQIRPQPAGTWDVTWETANVSGLSHLEGQVVSVLADGNVQVDKVVQGGSIPVNPPASRVIVGLNYVADLQTLRLESQPTVQGREKKIPAMTIRVTDTRGLWAGMTEATVTELKERNPALLPGVATPLITGDLRIIMDPLWEADGQVWIKAPYPLPANVLAVIPEVVMGG